MANKSSSDWQPIATTSAIDWALVNALRAFATNPDLMRGEERTLTPEELEEINGALRAAQFQVEVVKGLFEQARQRGGLRVK